MKQHPGIVSVALLALGLIVASCGGGNSKPPAAPVTIQLAWTHQAQFAGLYAAEQQGFYKAEGLAPTFIQGGATVDKLAPVLDGRAQFGVAGADELILARAGGKPLKAVATIYRRSPVVFVSLTEKGITRPQNLAGKTIRVAPNVLPSLQLMMANVGIRPDAYSLATELPADLAMFASGSVPVWGLFDNSLGVAIQQAGYKVNKIYPDDYGVHFYADTLFTTDDLISRDPGLVQRFVRATLKGWTWAVENPDAAGRLSRKYAPDASDDLEIARMVANIPLVNTGVDHIGWMNPETWAAMEQAFRHQGLLTRPLNIADVYTTQFIAGIYD